MNTTRIVIFAKAPVAGQVKTRLIPALGAEAAARLARRMLEATIAQALAADIGPVELCVIPDIDANAWHSIPLPTGIACSAQGDGDLGTRMARAAQRSIERGETVLLIGTDVPTLNATLLRAAATSLQTTDATLCATVDGGYALLGLRRFDPLIFSAIAWSTDQVAQATLKRIAQLGWSVHNGPLLRDIDEPGDLDALPTDWHEGIYSNQTEP